MTETLLNPPVQIVPMKLVSVKTAAVSMKADSAI